VYEADEKQKWEPVSRNKKDAQRRLAEIVAELYQGTVSIRKPISFTQFSEQWLQDYAEGSVKPLTQRFYHTLLKNHLKPAFGALPLTHITPQHIHRFRTDCLREKNLSPKTVNSLLTLLKTILKFARQWNYIRENPAETVNRARVEQREMAFLHPDEFRMLLQRADEPYRTLFLTAGMTGMRRGELLALQWGDIDWHNGIIHVRRSLYRVLRYELTNEEQSQKVQWRFSTPKSLKSNRDIVMSPLLKEALELHRLACPVSPHDLVFCNKHGNPLHQENMVKREFLPALSQAGLRRIRFHDLRHTYVTFLIAQGTNPKFIQSQLGHASIQTTFDRYGHLLSEKGREAGERLDALVFGSSNPLGANGVLMRGAELLATNINQQQQGVQRGFCKYARNPHGQQRVAIDSEDR